MILLAFVAVDCEVRELSPIYHPSSLFIIPQQLVNKIDYFDSSTK